MLEIIHRSRTQPLFVLFPHLYPNPNGSGVHERRPTSFQLKLYRKDGGVRINSPTMMNYTEKIRRTSHEFTGDGKQYPQPQPCWEIAILEVDVVAESCERCRNI